MAVSGQTLMVTQVHVFASDKLPDMTIGGQQTNMANFIAPY